MNVLLCVEPYSLVMKDQQSPVHKVMGEEGPFDRLTVPLKQSKKYEAVSAVPSIYVTGIPLSEHPMSTNEGLRDIFEAFGVVSDIYFVSPRPRDDDTPKSSTRGEPSFSDGDDARHSFQSAIVKFENWTSTEKAYVAYNNDNHNKDSTVSSICVRYARPRHSGDEAISPRRLFIGQIPHDCTEDDLRNYFSRFGNIVELSLFDKSKKGTPRCAFIEYDSWAASEDAIAGSHGKVVFSSSTSDDHQNKAIVVKYAKAKVSQSTRQSSLSPEMHDDVLNAGAFWPMPVYPGYLPYEQPIIPLFYQPVPEVLVYQEHVDRRKLFVGQLPLYATEDALMSIFACFGHVEQVSILPQRGCGFITFQYRHQASLAAQHMNGRPFSEGSRPMVVKFASRRTPATTPSPDPSEVDS